MDLLQMDCLREPFFDHDDRHRHLAVRILKVPRNPTNFAFICTQVGLILDIFLFFVCKKHYFEK